MKTCFTILAALCLFLGAGCVSTPQSRAEAQPELFDTYTTAQKELILKGKVEIGFDQNMVLMAAGAPDKKARRTSEDGITEVWTYYDYVAHPVVFSSGYGWGRYFYYDHGSSCWIRRGYNSRVYVDNTNYSSEVNLKVEFKEGEVVAFETTNP